MGKGGFRVRKYKLSLLLVLLLAVWSGSIGYYESQKLKNPIFLEHYYELDASLFAHTSIYYIANTDMKKKPYQYELPNGAWLRVHHSLPRSEFGRLQVMEQILSPATFDMQKITEPYAFDRMRVYYTDGTEEVVSIGSITIFPNRSVTGESRMEQAHSAGSSDGSGSTGYRVKQAITLHSLKLSFERQLQGVFTAELNGKDALDRNGYPMTLQPGDYIGMEYRFQLPPMDERRHHAYRLRLTLLDAEGREAASHGIIGQWPQFDNRELLSYVRQRNGGQD